MRVLETRGFFYLSYTFYLGLIRKSSNGIREWDRGVILIPLETLGKDGS